MWLQTPMLCDFETFPKFWDAMNTFYDMIHSEEFQIGISMQEDDLLIINK
jgi:hypothetical protein